jgi:uncharacterized protein (UPF0128 family)
MQQLQLAVMEEQELHLQYQALLSHMQVEEGVVVIIVHLREQVEVAELEGGEMVQFKEELLSQEPLTQVAVEAVRLIH